MESSFMSGGPKKHWCEAESLEIGPWNGFGCSCAWWNCNLIQKTLQNSSAGYPCHHHQAECPREHHSLRMGTAHLIAHCVLPPVATTFELTLTGIQLLFLTCWYQLGQICSPSIWGTFGTSSPQADLHSPHSHRPRWPKLHLAKDVQWHHPNLDIKISQFCRAPSWHSNLRNHLPQGPGTGFPDSVAVRVRVSEGPTGDLWPHTLGPT